MQLFFSTILMSKKEKLLSKFLSKPTKKDLTFQELETLLFSLGYKKIEGAGSRVKFVHEITQDIINLHQPHPSPVLKIYQIQYLQEKLNSFL